MRWYLDGEADLDFVRARIAKNTRVYAKKQLTWLRRDSDVVWLKPTGHCRRPLGLSKTLPGKNDALAEHLAKLFLIVFPV